MRKTAVVGSTVAGGFAPTASEGIYVKPGSKAMDTGTSLLKESFPTILFLKIIFTPSKAGETDEELRQWHIDMSEAKGEEENDSSEGAGNAPKYKYTCQFTKKFCKTKEWLGMKRFRW